MTEFWLGAVCGFSFGVALALMADWLFRWLDEERRDVRWWESRDEDGEE